MKTVSFLIVLFIVNVNTLFANELFITMSPLNCITCSSGVYDLARENSINIISIVLESKYKEDSTEIEEMYSLSKFPKIKVVFSDSLYKHFSHDNNNPELIIADARKAEIYRSSLKSIDMRAIHHYFPLEKTVEISKN
ncbi:MAG: hypothetical protein JST82_03125 [Bacteroidetes bacterium]|nr:hypothetical protein [Bacteroidota bacterium]